MILVKTAEFAQRVTRIRAEGFRRALAQKDKVATASTANSIRSQFIATPFLIRGTVYAGAGFKFILSGRKAGSKLPPPGVLIPWMRARGITSSSTPESEEKSIDFLIRRKIAKDGIAPTDLNSIALSFTFSEPQVRTRLRLLVGEDSRDFMLAQAALIWSKGRTISL